MNHISVVVSQPMSSPSSLPPSLSLSPVPAPPTLLYTHHLIVDGSNVVVENGDILFILRRADLDGFLIAFYCLFIFLLLEKVITLLLNHPSLIQSTLVSKRKTIHCYFGYMHRNFLLFKYFRLEQVDENILTRIFRATATWYGARPRAMKIFLHENF